MMEYYSHLKLESTITHSRISLSSAKFEILHGQKINMMKTIKNFIIKLTATTMLYQCVQPMNSDHESKPLTTASDVPQLTRLDDTHVNFPVYEEISDIRLTVTKNCYID